MTKPAFLVCTLLLAFTTSAAANSDVYHSVSDDGVAPGGTPVLPAPAGWLKLYVDRTTTGQSGVGTPCVDGDGEEICAWQVAIEAGPGVAFGAFLPQPGVEYVLTADELRANALHGLSPDVEPIRLGALAVISTNPATGGDVTLASAQVVTADFALEPVAPKTLAVVPVPEPGPLLQWASGVAALVVLSRWRKRARGLAAWLVLPVLATGMLSPGEAVARQNTCDWEYPNGCAGTIFDPCLYEDSVSRDCGGFEEPICKSGAPCDAGLNPIGGVCTNECGVSESITCSNGCVAGVDTYSLDPIRAEVRAGVPGTPGIDAQIEAIQTQIEDAIADAEAAVRANVPSAIPNPIEQNIEEIIIECITGFIPNPALLDNYGATANYCFDTNPVAFDDPGAPSWPVTEAPPGARTVISIHGRLGGGYDPATLVGIGGEFEPAAEIRAFTLDYNAQGAVSQPMRVYARLADGSWSPDPVFEGPVSDGTNFTIPDVSKFLADFIAQLPEVGPIAVVAFSQGGFVAKDLVYRYYDALRSKGREIVSVTFIGHPHFGIVIPPEDYVWVICSDILVQSGQAGSLTPQEVAQDCATGRWMLGWNAAAAGLGPFTPYLDNRSHPQIRWTTVAGNAGGPGGFLDFPFWDKFTSVLRSSVIGDGTVPTDSSLGLDTYGSFHVGDLQFDQSVLTGAGHDAGPLRAGLEAVEPDWLRHRAVCGDVDGFEGLSVNDVKLLQLGLVDGAVQPPDFLPLCSVSGAGECDLRDAVRLQRQVAGLEPRGLQVCPAVAPSALTAFYSSLAAWLAAIGSSEYDRLPTTAAYLAQADEVAAPPANNTELCGAANPSCTLSFPRESTALCRDFEVQAFQGITFNDSESSGVVWPDALSIGDIDNGENDDFEIRIPDATPLYAAGFTLVDNTAEAGESLTVIGQSGAVLGRLDGTAIANGFVGVVSSEPIASLYFDEHPGGDDIAIQDFVFERSLADCDDVPSVQFTTNLTTWSNIAGTAYVLTTTAANVALANEVPSPPGPNAQLCGTPSNYQVPCTLTWEAASTGACRDFALGVQQGITFDDNEFSYTNSLSIGDVDNGENDDFVVTFGGGPPTHAFGFTLLNNGFSLGEEIRVYDTGGVLIGRDTVLPENVDSAFIGITSNQPIGRVEFDEDAGGDDIAIRDLRMDCDGLP